MLNYKKERTSVGRTAEYVKEYLDGGGVISEEFANYLINLSLMAALNMKLTLPSVDYEEAVMHGVYAAMRYGLKNIKKIEPEKTYYYLLMSCKSGICRFLEKYNKNKKRYIVTDFNDLALKEYKYED